MSYMWTNKIEYTKELIKELAQLMIKNEKPITEHFNSFFANKFSTYFQNELNSTISSIMKDKWNFTQFCALQEILHMIPILRSLGFDVQVPTITLEQTKRLLQRRTAMEKCLNLYGSIFRQFMSMSGGGGGSQDQEPDAKKPCTQEAPAPAE